MWRRLQEHEARVLRALDQEVDLRALERLRQLHLREIAWMQHERLIHLVVTMFVALFALLSLFFVSLQFTWATALLAVVLLGLCSAYLVHYFRLENGVQRWYALAERIDERLGRAP